MTTSNPMNFLGLTIDQMKEKLIEEGEILLLEEEISHKFFTQINWEKNNVTEKKLAEFERARASKKEEYTWREFKKCFETLKDNSIFFDGISMYMFGVEFSISKGKFSDSRRGAGQSNVQYQLNYQGGIIEWWEGDNFYNDLKEVFKDFSRRIANRGLGQVSSFEPKNICPNPFEDERP